MCMLVRGGDKCKITVLTNTINMKCLLINSCAHLPVVNSESCKRFLSFKSEYLTNGFLQFYATSH